MKLKLSKESKLDLINKFFKGEKASDLAKRYNISKVLFYKYLDRYKKYGVKGLEEGKPGRKRKPRNAHVQMPSKSLTPLERFRMVQEVTEEGKAISEVAKKYQVSRNTLYKWIDRYKKSEKERINKVYDKERIVGRYYNQTPEFYNEAVLNLVEKHPEYGINKLVENLPKFGHKPILGYHGVQNILRRNDLSTYDRRAAFAQTKVTAVNSTITGILKHVERFFRIVPAIRSKIVKAGLIVFLSIFSIIVISGFIQAIDKPFRDLDGFTIVGGIFALISLFAGTFFFLYSLKYYLTIALVLSYAQTDFFGKDSEAKRKGFLNWLLGITNGTNGNVRDLSNPDSIQSNTPVGLEPNLEHVILKRFPFISVHIPFYNEKNVVERAIKAATSFDYPGDYEVILCDDSTDETTQIIRGYMHESGSANNKTSLSTIKNEKEGWELASVKVRPGVTLKHLHRTTRSGFKGGALKIALTLVDPVTEFVSIFDADFVPYPDTLELFMKYFQAQAGTLEFQGNSDYQYNTNTNLRRLTDTDDSGVSGNTTNNQTQTQAYAQTQTTAVKSSIAAVCGYQWHVLNKSENWITRGVRTEYAGSYVIERSGQEILGAFKQIHGSVYAIRRDVLEEVGWETSITEDFELTLKLYDAGYKVVYTPYIQAPAECVSTLKRLIRQRMRWAEGHSFNVKKMWKRLLFGKWVDVVSTSTPINSNNYQYQVSENIQPQTAGHRFGIGSSSKRFIPSPLTPMEKLEFIYLSPYYLQAFFFLLGTFSWLISETIFRVHLPFWTELWGWSLVLTNMISLPLMNAVGMFLEESEERDYLGLGSFVVLSYLVVPFQAYASVKGFLEDHEGPWFRTPKTGRITDVFTRGRFYRFISGIMPGRNEATSLSASVSGTLPVSSYLLLNTANNHFSSFRIVPAKFRWIGNLTLISLLIFTILLSTFTKFVPTKASEVYAAERQFQTISSVVNKHTIDLPPNIEINSIEDGELKNPVAIRYQAEEGKALEYIFHKEPRIRARLNDTELDMTLTGIEGVGRPNNQKTTKEGRRFIYKDTFDSIDVTYTPDGGIVREELILHSYKDIKSIEYDIKTNNFEATIVDDEVYFADKNGGMPVFNFSRAFMYEERNPHDKKFEIEYTLEKTDFGWKLKKVLTTEGRAWLSDPARVFPIIIDPTLVNSVIQTGITTTEARYGSVQRKIAFSARGAQTDAWYVVYENSTTAVLERCLTTSNCDENGDWTVVDSNLDAGNETDSESPSVWLEGTTLYVAWFDNSLDTAQFIPVNTSTEPETNGQQCTGDDAGSTADGQVSITVTDDGDVYTAYTNPGDAEWAIDRSVSTCTNTNTANGYSGGANGNIGTGSGLTSNDPVELTSIGNNVLMVYNDGDLSASSYVDDASPAWDQSNIDINGGASANADGDFSVVTDGTDVWVLQAISTTGTELWKCAACNLSSHSWSSQTAPITSTSNLSYVSLGYISSSPSNTLVAVYMTGTAEFEGVNFKTSDADTILWSSQNQLGFGAGGTNGLDTLSVTANVVNDTEFGAITDDNVATPELEFSTLPENLLFLLLGLPVLSKFITVLRKPRVIARG